MSVKTVFNKVAQICKAGIAFVDLLADFYDASKGTMTLKDFANILKAQQFL